MNKIFGIGWAKTGTTTLGKSFKILGFNHQSVRLELVKNIAKGDLSEIMAIAKGKQTFEDQPWAFLYRELDSAFPDSRFILTLRDTDKWLRSYRNMLTRKGRASEELNEIRRILYGLPFPNVTDEQLIGRYEKHNRDVQEYFRDRPGSLLVVNWENGDGWEKLCNFLLMNVPDVPFPHANQGSYSKTALIKRKLRKLIRR